MLQLISELKPRNPSYIDQGGPKTVESVRSTPYKI